MPKVIPATVTGGRGIASARGVDDMQALSAIYGKRFVAGSLNLVSNIPVWLKPQSAIYRTGASLFWRASLEGVPVVIARWAQCPAHVFEICATVHLRTALGLRDGEVARLEIPDDIISRSDATLLSKVVWGLCWRFRESQIYRDGRYFSFMRSRKMLRYAWRSLQPDKISGN